MSGDSENKSRADLFVEEVFARKENDKAYRARLRAAVNPLREWNAWGDIAQYVNLQDASRRRLFLTIGAAIAWSNETQNGDSSLGKALQKSWQDKGTDKASPSMQRLRRLLACTSSDSVCQVIRPLLKLISSRQAAKLNYAELLKQLLIFDQYSDSVKARWAQDYFSADKAEEESEGKEEQA